MPRAAWTYYGKLLLLLPRALFSATDHVLKSAAVIAFIALVLNREWASRLDESWSGVSPGWAVAPILAIAAYVLAKENYRNVATQARRDLKLRLGGLLEEGAVLQRQINMYDPPQDAGRLKPDVVSWRDRVLAFIEAEIPDERAFFVTDSPSPVFGSQHKDKSELSNYMLKRMERLAEIHVRL